MAGIGESEQQYRGCDHGSTCPTQEEKMEKYQGRKLQLMWKAACGPSDKRKINKQINNNNIETKAGYSVPKHTVTKNRG